MPVLRCEGPSFPSREKLSKRSNFFISASLLVIFGGYDRQKKPDNHVYLVMNRDGTFHSGSDAQKILFCRFLTSL